MQCCGAAGVVCLRLCEVCLKRRAMYILRLTGPTFPINVIHRLNEQFAYTCQVDDYDRLTLSE